MTLLHALSVLAVALGQPELLDPSQPPAAPAAPSARAPAAAPAPSAPAPRAPAEVAPKEEPAPPKEAPARQLPLSEPRLIPVERADPKPPADLRLEEGAPVLRSDRTSRCFERPGGGRWRAQCDSLEKRCLVAPDAELSADGEPLAGLDRAAPCVVPGWREDDLVGQGYAMVPALAETPPGWVRDERQRLMQVNFDLNRRIWLGAGYALGDLPGSDAGEATAGIRVDVPFRLAGAPALLRLRAVETYAAFTGDATDFTAVGLDASRAYPSPLLRLTTFVGKPRRFDPPLYVGAWVEALRVESLHTAAGWFDRTGVASGAITFDLWRSRDLASFVRLRGGFGYEVADPLDGAAWVPHAALDADVSLDRRGFHHLRLTAVSEWLLETGAGDYQPEDPLAPRLPEDRTRLTGKLEYEVVFAAVNDQPLSLVLDARTCKRNDVPGLSTGWLVQGTASVRVNLWAPARRDAAAQERL